MVNKVAIPNPFGDLDFGDLERLEDDINAILPDPYREYLIRCNGGEFERKVVDLPDGSGSTTVHHMFGLHLGPEYRQILKAYKESIAHAPETFLPICDDSFGNIFYLKIKGENAGAVYFADHEKIQGFKNVKDLIFVASGFDDFVQNMKSDEEVMDDFKKVDPEGFNEFEKRLQEMRRLREKELKK